VYKPQILKEKKNRVRGKKVMPESKRGSDLLRSSRFVKVKGGRGCHRVNSVRGGAQRRSYTKKGVAPCEAKGSRVQDYSKDQKVEGTHEERKYSRKMEHHPRICHPEAQRLDIA